MFSPEDFFIIGLLVFLEGVLSIDNALVLALLARPLPPKQQRRALTYGLLGAVVFRLAAIGIASYLIQWRWIKFIGGGYLLWLGVGHFLRSPKKTENAQNTSINFWKTVLIIELTDIAFAVDSILAAVALTPKFWLVFTGGILGVILMRFAAGVFLNLLKRFPKFESTAYLLILLIGFKVILEGMHIPSIDFHSIENPAFWIFWCLMLVCILYGFKPNKKEHK